MDIEELPIKRVFRESGNGDLHIVMEYPGSAENYQVRAERAEAQRDRSDAERLKLCRRVESLELQLGEAKVALEDAKGRASQSSVAVNLEYEERLRWAKRCDFLTGELRRHGFTYVEGADHWKPPLGQPPWHAAKLQRQLDRALGFLRYLRWFGTAKYIEENGVSPLWPGDIGPHRD